MQHEACPNGLFDVAFASSINFEDMSRLSGHLDSLLCHSGTLSVEDGQSNFSVNRSTGI